MVGPGGLKESAPFRHIYTVANWCRLCNQMRYGKPQISYPEWFETAAPLPKLNKRVVDAAEVRDNLADIQVA